MWARYYQMGGGYTACSTLCCSCTMQACVLLNMHTCALL
jgi:hypothetical protein